MSKITAKQRIVRELTTLLGFLAVIGRRQGKSGKTEKADILL